MLLSASETEIYRSIIENNPDPIFILDVDGIIKETNFSVTKVFGYSQEEVQEMKFRDLIAPEYYGKGLQISKQLLHGISYEGYFKAIHKNGNTLHLYIKYVPIVIENSFKGIYSEIKKLFSSNETVKNLNGLEENYKLLFDSASTAINIFDLEGNVIDANPAFEELYGWKLGEVIGKPLPVVLNNRSDKLKSLIKKIKIGKTFRAIEGECIKKDGTTIFINLTISPIRDTNGNIVAISGMTKDLTRQKVLEEAVRESEDRYRKVVDLSPIGIMIHREDTILLTNPSAAKILNEDHLVGSPLSLYIHPDFIDIYKQRVSGANVGKRLQFIEIIMIRRDGKEIDVEVGGALINYDGVPAILTVISDITDRKRRDRALKDSEERYRLLANNSLDLIQLVKLNGIVTYASPSHKKVLGYEPEEYLGKRVFHQPNGEKDDTFMETFLNMARNKKPFTIEIVRRHKAGYMVWIELEGTPAFDENGQFKYMIIVGREMTDRKKREKQMEYLSCHDALTGLPNRRLFSDKLKQCIKESKKSNSKFALMFLDLDKFKHVNDTFGHDVGDELLKQFTDRVQRCIRNQDVFVRLGGDEFVILLPDTMDVSKAEVIANRINKSIQEPWKIFYYEFVTTSSIGIALFEKGDREKDLLKKADLALYQAKAKGKNTFSIYNQN